MSGGVVESQPSGPGAPAVAPITLPKGGGAIRGMGEKFAANPATGTAAMTVPIATSPGRTGFGPTLSLSLHLYRPRIEGLFARIERWVRAYDQDTHWRSISRDNVLTVYGSTPESRITDPDDGSRVFSWLVAETRDDKGNAVFSTYKPEERLDSISERRTRRGVPALALLARPTSDGPATLDVDGLQTGATVTLSSAPTYGGLLSWSAEAGVDEQANVVLLTLTAPTGAVELSLSSKALDDIWLGVTWSATA